MPTCAEQDEAGAGGSDLEGLRLRPGLAMSQDGRNWARIEAEHHSGALFDVGQPGEWDELFIGGPQVRAGVQAAHAKWDSQLMASLRRARLEYGIGEAALGSQCTQAPCMLLPWQAARSVQHGPIPTFCYVRLGHFSVTHTHTNTPSHTNLGCRW